MRSRAAAASLALLVLLLGGCASIPDSGGVNAGEPATGEETLELDLLAASPVKGATQEEILQGFLDAATSPRGNYAVARQYLAPGLAEEWQPGSGATIDRFAQRETERVDAEAMRIEATPVAELAQNGQYRTAESTAPVTLAYRFVQVGGEWRIAEAPAGILIDESNFLRVYRTHTLYFYDPEFRYAVPDVRWFAGRESVQTSIVRALLAGPAEWLDPGVESAFPEGVRLDPDAVPIDGGIASVSIEGVTADDELAVQRMRFQLAQSLENVRNVDDVALALDGTVQTGPLTFSAVTDPTVEPRAVVYDGTTFGFLASSGDRISPIEGLSDQVAALQPTAAALGRDAESVAVRSAEGVYLVQRDEEAVRVDARPGLVAPTIDGHGFVWTVPAAAPGAVFATAADGGQIALAPPWGGTSIAAIEVAADGTRIVALLDEGGRSRFVAASIQRGADGVPEALGSVPLELADEAGVARDVAWLDAGTAAALTASSGGGSGIVTQVLGSQATTRDGPTGGQQLDSGAGARELRVLTSAGELDTVSGAGWQSRATGLRFIASRLAG